MAEPGSRSRYLHEPARFKNACSLRRDGFQVGNDSVDVDQALLADGSDSLFGKTIRFFYGRQLSDNQGFRHSNVIWAVHGMDSWKFMLAANLKTARKYFFRFI